MTWSFETDRLKTSSKQVESINRQEQDYSTRRKKMDNEKAKRIRNAHRAFVQKAMEGATRILVEQTADRSRGRFIKGKTSGIDIHPE